MFFFFCEESRDYIRQDSYRKAQRTKKLQRSPFELWHRLRRARRHAGETRRITSETLDWEAPHRDQEVERSSVPKHLHPARRTATPPWPSATASFRSSITRSAISRNPAKGKPSRELRRAANEDGAADPRRSSTGAAPSEEKTTATKSHSGTTASTPALPASTPPRTPRLCTHRDPWIPRPPAAEAAAGGRGIRRIAGGELARAESPKKSPFHCRWGKGGRSNSPLGKKKISKILQTKICKLLFGTKKGGPSPLENTMPYVVNETGYLLIRRKEEHG